VLTQMTPHIYLSRTDCPEGRLTSRRPSTSCATPRECVRQESSTGTPRQVSSTSSSVGWYLLLLIDCPISLSSKKIKVMSLSSFESEPYSALICGAEVEVLRRLLEDLCYSQADPTVLFEDNNCTCIHSSDPDRPLGARSKHIDTRVYRRRDLVRDKMLSLVNVGTGEQMADGLTKALPAPAVAAFRRVMSAS
jgi:hypothetical protein